MLRSPTFLPFCTCYYVINRLSLRGQAGVDQLRNGYVSGTGYNRQDKHGDHGIRKRPDLSRFDEREERDQMQ